MRLATTLSATPWRPLDVPLRAAARPFRTGGGGASNDSQEPGATVDRTLLRFQPWRRRAARKDDP
ncbi:hypothetical protein GCM10010502_65410 [Kitasatospora aureofaciens]|uniref:Uncharacterized protein n=1 Tax=Kitasatospora aureofaciens TaxID=1894 RepID=A0A8H9LXJ7_KITAU|nr:hypothetical protein GCM10010502_65410 [Kitasatospora aureofaciens]